MRRVKKLQLSLGLTLVYCCLAASSAMAKQLQILHTNDLHGFFEHTIRDEAVGGYAALKGVIDQQKKLAADQGLDSIVMDSGDFMEGNLFYMAQEGQRVFKIMGLIGYDAVVMGNHDYLMGTDRLESIIGNNIPNFKFLGANFKLDHASSHPMIAEQVKDYAILTRAGVKIGIIGLTTDEITFSWRFEGGHIGSPVTRAQVLTKELKAQGVDYIIALTHIGTSADRELVKATRNIDLVVGGHSHNALFKPVYEKNVDGKQIPIVQAGSHGNYLGRVVLDVEKGKEAKLSSYELLPIENTAQNRDPHVHSFIQESKQEIYQKYGKEWLNTVVGEAKVPLVNSDSVFTPWTAFVSSAIKQAAKAELAFHYPGFAGADLPIGPVTREKLFNAYPRVFDFEDKFGWAIYTAQVKGVLLKSTLKVALSMGMVMSFSGITFDLERRKDLVSEDGDEFTSVTKSQEGNSVIDPFSGNEDYRIRNIRVNGQPIQNMRNYLVAFPAGIIHGGDAITGAFRYIFQDVRKLDKHIWAALEEKFKKVKVIDVQYARRIMGGQDVKHDEVEVPLAPGETYSISQDAEGEFYTTVNP